MEERILVNIVNDNETITASEKKDIKLYELAEKYFRDENGYKAIFASVDNEGSDLLRRINRPCTVKFLTLKSRLARLVYQRSIYFLFLIALNEIKPGASAVLRYPLNDGLLIQIRDDIERMHHFVWMIEKRMRDLVAENIMFTRRIIRRDEILGENEYEGRDHLPESITDAHIEFIKGSEIKEVFEYSYNGFSAIFYDPLMQSSGSLDIFDVVPYNGDIIIRVPQAANTDSIPKYRDDKKLYQALKDISKWQKYVGVRNISDLNRKLSGAEWHEFILINEAMHEKKIAMIADQIVKQKKRIILIAGPSSSGKTTFAQRLCIQLRVNGLRPMYMGTDDYFVERHQVPVDENGKFNFEDLEAVDVELFNKHMNDLLDGKTVDMPVFDFIAGSKRYGMRVTRAEEDQPIVIEGIHALNSRLTYGLAEKDKFRIYISPLTTLNIDDKNRIPLTDIRFIRRMARDMRSRNKTARQTIAEWPDVRAGEIKNIFPYSGEADVMFNSTLLYELAALKPLVEESLMDIKNDEPQYLEAQRLLRMLRCVNVMENTGDVTNNSIIREFIGGGIWVK